MVMTQGIYVPRFHHNYLNGNKIMIM
jgi:hypothetical protein